MFCDIPNIGKTVAAQYHAKTHKNVVYVDCSQVKTKQRLFRFIAREFGLNSVSRYADVYDDLVFYLRIARSPANHPLDEVGDLVYEAFLEIKAAWNGTEGCCSWHLMEPTDRAPLERGIEFKTVGFAEIRAAAA